MITWNGTNHQLYPGEQILADISHSNYCNFGSFQSQIQSFPRQDNNLKKQKIHLLILIRILMQKILSNCPLFLFLCFFQVASLLSKGIHALSSYKDQVLNLPISIGFGKIKGQKIFIFFILIRNFESLALYLTNNIMDFETTELDFSYPWILGISRVFLFFSIIINIYKNEK